MDEYAAYRKGGSPTPKVLEARMTYEFRVRTVADYHNIPKGLDRTQRAMKVQCAIIGMTIFEQRHDTSHPMYVHSQTMAIAWASA